MILLLRAGNEAREGRVKDPDGREVTFREIDLLRLSPVLEGLERFQSALEGALPGTWVLFTSPNTLPFLSFPATPGKGASLGPLLSHLRRNPLAAIGEGTAARMRELSLTPAYLPSTPNGREVAKGLKAAGALHVIWPGSRTARREIAGELDSVHISVEQIPVYEEVPDVEAIAEALTFLHADRADGGILLGGESKSPSIEAVGFTSPGVVAAIAERAKESGWALPDFLSGRIVGAIGRTTALTLERYGIRDVRTSPRAGIEELLALLASSHRP